MNKRLKRMMSPESLGIPFDIDFLREIGIEIGKDWDDELIIKYPDDIPVRMRELIEKFRHNIKRRLFFEGERAKSCFVGGSLNGHEHGFLLSDKPFCYHLERGKWEVYIVKSHNDPRAWFAGIASSKKKARLLQFIRTTKG